MELEEVDYRKPLIVALGSVIANLAIVAYSQIIVGTSPEFEPLTYSAVGIATAISAFGAWSLFELKKRYLENPYQKFLQFSSFVLIASFGTILYAIDQPGSGMEEIAMLSLTHVVAAITIVGTLLNLELNQNR